jgi:hypothetical protein
LLESLFASDGWPRLESDRVARLLCRLVGEIGGVTARSASCDSGERGRSPAGECMLERSIGMGTLRWRALSRIPEGNETASCARSERR